MLPLWLKFAQRPMSKPRCQPLAPYPASLLIQKRYLLLLYTTPRSAANKCSDATFDFCNVTFAYSHNGRDDQVFLNFWLPSPANFRNRYLSAGGGLAINSGLTTSGSLPGGTQYGAVSGLTDGGFGSFTNQFDNVSFFRMIPSTGKLFTCLDIKHIRS